MAMLVRPAKPGACPLKRASPPGRSRSVVRAQCDDRSSQPVGLIPAGVVTGLVSFSLLFTPLAHADLNRREADLGGEFDRGSAKQYGEMDIIVSGLLTPACGCPLPRQAHSGCRPCFSEAIAA